VLLNVIDEIRRTDREPLHRLLVETGFFSEDEIAIALELIDVVLDRPGQKDYMIRVCRDSDQVLGYYCVGPTPATESTYDLYWIAVAPAMHGKGIGGALNGHLEELIRSRGGNLVVAETSSRPQYEKTRRFYRSCGYAELARIAGYYRPGDDLVVFGKYLSQP
jgi:ribosomal protein S18 acetylase RimI-like enzyme